MERKINKEIREYREAMFWGLTLRQFLFLFWDLAYLSGYIFCCGEGSAWRLCHGRVSSACCPARCSAL